MKLFCWIVLMCLFAATADAATYWVNGSASGSHCIDSASDPGAGSSSQTVAQGLACAGAPGTTQGAGDTVIVKAGTYTNQSNVDNIPSGTSGNQFTLKCETSRQCIMQVTNTFNTAFISIGGNATSYVTVQGFVIDGLNRSVHGFFLSSGSANQYVGWQILDNEIKNMGEMGVEGSSVNNSRIAGNWIHDVGAPCNDSGGTSYLGFCHGIYLTVPSSGSPGRSNNNIIEDNIINNNAGFGVHFWDSTAGDNHIVRRNRIFHNGFNGPNPAGGITAYGNGHQFYNNLIYDNYIGFIIRGDNNKIYENTVWSNPNGGILNDYDTGTAADCRNNLAVDNGVAQIRNCATNQNNITTATGSTYFVNPNTSITADFSLKAATTPGVDLSSLIGCTAGTTCNDFTNQTIRPQGGTWDVGAYEYAPFIPPVTNPQLVLALPLDAGGGTTAIDVSGQNNNATLVGGAIWDNAGKYGKAIMFNGTGYLNIPASASLALAPAITIEAWVYPTVASALFTTVLFQDRYYLYASSEPGYCPTPAGAPGGGYSAATVENYICATSLPPVNEWSHLAITQDGLNTSFYLNGSIVASKIAAEPMVSATANVTIGKSAFGEYFTGKIDEPRVYNYARTPAQILSDMNTPLIGGPGKVVEIAAPASVEISSTSSLEISAD